MSKLRLVIDTNIFISALLSKKSNPFKVVNFAFKYHIFLSSQETISEFKKVIFRKKFDKYF
ncbi:MAG: putative toxin-antitoxin system toxin component, PIN family [Symploca sp. SIO2C1]|nr:putative toxin-antitoxin system toxin component, PIN family [Symploca sp. SIO2C1]